jgi:hypothetical protein
MNSCIINDLCSLFLKEASPPYYVFPISGVKLPPEITNLFGKYKNEFSKYQNLWVKGGGAREALITYISDITNKYDFGRFERAIQSLRDVDLVMFGEYNYQLIDDFEKDVDPVDIEFNSSLENYFATRDMSFNEILLRPEKIAFSKRAVRDITKNKNTISPYEVKLNHNDNPYISYRVALRDMLMAARYNLTPSTFTKQNLYDFSPYVLLNHLFKAYELNIENKFYDLIDEYISDYIFSNSVDQLLVSLIEGYPNYTLTPSQRKIHSNVIHKMKQSYWHEKYEEQYS